MAKHQKIIIAIDGFAATGKSSIAKRLSNSLNYIHIDSGSMYRAATLFALRLDSKKKLDPKKIIQSLSEIKIEFKTIKEKQLIFLNNENVSYEIRKPYVTNQVSKLAKIPELRSYLVKKQKEFGKNKGIIMDGRDIGTIVFPEAECKFFLVANVEVRAKRRYFEQQSKDNKETYEKVLKSLIKRDKLDTDRISSPLMKAKGALKIDVSDLTLDEVYDKMLSYIKKKLNKH